MSDYETFLAEDARLVILKELARQTNKALNSSILQRVLETFGHLRSRDWVDTQLLALEDVGAIKTTAAGTVLIATLRQPGLDHVERRRVLSGVSKPSLDA